MKLINCLTLFIFILIAGCIPAPKKNDLTSTGPAISISSPTGFNSATKSVSYTVTYTNANEITLSSNDITLNTTGTVTGIVSVTGSGNVSRLVTIGEINGVGTLSISINAGSASDIKLKKSSSSGISPSAIIQSTTPVITISPPSSPTTSSGPIVFTINYSNAASINLNSSQVSLDTTGTATGTISILGNDNLTRIVQVSNITGDGTIGLIITSNSAVSSAGTFADGARSNYYCKVYNQPPVISISSPSVSATYAGPVSYTVNYSRAESISLNTSQITLNKTGNANGTIAISGSGTLARVVTISNITGDGNLGITVDATSASNTISNSASTSATSSTFLANSTLPGFTISAPSITSTSKTNVTFDVIFNGAYTTNLNSSDIIINKTGTAKAVASVTSAGNNTKTVTLSSISGDGTISISIGANVIYDAQGNYTFVSQTSQTVTIDNTPPVISIANPSLSLTNSTPVTYLVTYSDPAIISLTADKVLLKKSGTANATVAISGTGPNTRTITLSNITGDGTLAISLAANTAADSLGNQCAASLNSTAFTVDNTGPIISISKPNPAQVTSGTAIYTLSASDAASLNLLSSNITLQKTGSANGTVTVTGAGLTSRTVTISNISGNGSLGISVAAGVASDVTGNLSLATDASTKIDVFNDPLFQYMWHIHNTGQTAFSSSNGTPGIDLNLMNTWSKGYFGQGVNILISDTGFQSAHEDLAHNFRIGNYSKDFINSPNADFSYPTAEPLLNSDIGQAHGTAVAGIIAAEMANGLGGIGVAPQAKIASANFINSNQTLTELLAQIDGDFKIINQSWGSSECTILPPDATYEAKLKSERKVYVKAAGNSFYQDMSECITNSKLTRHANANFDPFNANPYTIVVAAINANGAHASYSTAGSSVWITGFGGEFGKTSPAIITTDLTGCTYGMSPNEPYNSFQSSSNILNKNCNYTSTMNGTSSAAPTISGVAALLLSANSNLTTRDIKHILATTATQVNPNDTAPSNNAYVTSPTGHVWEQGWVKNAAGYNFHNQYGFGLVNTDAAVNMATSGYNALPVEVQTNYISSANFNLAIPDNSATGVTNTITVVPNLTIEAVQIKTTITHGNLGDVGIELTSPSGTKSIVMNINNALYGNSDLQNEVFLTNAFYGENSAGTWKIKVLDGSAGTVGQFLNWKINIIGH